MERFYFSHVTALFHWQQFSKGRSNLWKRQKHHGELPHWGSSQTEMATCTTPCYSRVPTPSNIADDPSRGDIHDLVMSGVNRTCVKDSQQEILLVLAEATVMGGQAVWHPQRVFAAVVPYYNAIYMIATGDDIFLELHMWCNWIVQAHRHWCQKKVCFCEGIHHTTCCSWMAANFSVEWCEFFAVAVFASFFGWVRTAWILRRRFSFCLATGNFSRVTAATNTSNKFAVNLLIAPYY